MEKRDDLLTSFDGLPLFPAKQSGLMCSWVSESRTTRILHDSVLVCPILSSLMRLTGMLRLEARRCYFQAGLALANGLQASRYIPSPSGGRVHSSKPAQSIRTKSRDYFRDQTSWIGLPGFVYMLVVLQLGLLDSFAVRSLCSKPGVS